jgi:hypothetical protein
MVLLIFSWICVMCKKVKVNLSLCLTKHHAMKTSRPGRFTHWIRGSVGSRVVLDTMVKRKIPSPCRESNPRTPNRPARSLVACVICTLCDRWRFLPVKYLSFENIVYLDRFHCFFQYVYDYQIVYNRPQMLLPHRF